MGLPSIFEVYSLAIGPSSLHTTGALRIGQAFRDLLLSSPYRPHQRIIIELLGNFAVVGRENMADQAVVSGLGGYVLENSNIRLQVFYKKIRESGSFGFMGDHWPFNPEADVIFNSSSKDYTDPNTIRFHLVNPDGQPVFQAEYQSRGNGLVRGPGIQHQQRYSDPPSIETFSEISRIIDSEKISLVDYIISGECSRFRLKPDQANKRMAATWKVMVNTLDHGLKNSGFLPAGTERQAMTLYKNYLRQIHLSPSLSPEFARCGLYAIAMAEEILDNRLVITAPTCSGAGIIPAAFKLLQENFMISDEKILEGLWVSGLVGSMIMGRSSMAGAMSGWRNEIAAGGIMAACGVSYIMGGSSAVLETASMLAAELFTDRSGKNTILEPSEFIRLCSLVAPASVNMFDLARIQDLQPGRRLDDALDYCLSF
jgi:L-serine dehydratase